MKRRRQPDIHDEVRKMLGQDDDFEYEVILTTVRHVHVFASTPEEAIAQALQGVYEEDDVDTHMNVHVAPCYEPEPEKRDAEEA